ncbi:hypothetical protein VMT65_27375 [Nocardia sp. CDC153]|uniref:hypothetical protein n=1 Tax=Nocardia sp. CDC153 TaxID=3112167 RepID=UPI002DBE806A|nr:hypothetical protein [Nocardia sp. CDC153]MEC3956786.1 hypothetical protein [Nocardia sp. CDC153]
MRESNSSWVGAGIGRRAFGRGILGGAALAGSARLASPASAAPAGRTYRLAPEQLSRTADRDFFGVNGARIISAENARQWHDPAFQDALAAVGPGLIRVQGGTTSQWIDWRTGLFDEQDGGGFAGRNAGRPPITLPDWADIVRRTGATPLFDLNVVTSTLDDQLDMLRAARRLGMPIRYVELGNELWVPMRAYSAVYPTGSDYARAMNDWISAIHGEFPGARIGVAAADNSPGITGAFGGQRYADWNHGLYETLRDADAVTFHPYWIVDPVAADIASTAVGGTVNWTHVADTMLRDMPTGLQAWFTEYNQMGKEATPPLDRLPAVRQTWAVGLSVASFTLRALLDPRAGMAVVHCALNGAPSTTTGGGGTTNQAVHALISDGSGGSALFGRTALNIALTPIYHCLDEATTVRSLRLDPGVESPAGLLLPPYIGVADAFTGAELSSAAGIRAILINTSDRSLRITLPPSLVGAQEVRILAAAPTAAPAFVAGDTVSETGATVSDVLDLPAYSQALLRRR